MAFPSSSSDQSPRRDFATTKWSVVLQASENRPVTGAEALEALCETYWYPLYAFVRRQGYEREDARDLTQGYFARLLEKQDLAVIDPKKGRFRSFLLASMKHYLMNEWDKGQAQKRGGGSRRLSLDFADAEEKFARELANERTAESDFDRQWAIEILARVQSRLQAEFLTHGKGELFETLQVFLVGSDPALRYSQVARRLGMTESAVKSAIHRMRRKYGELLREEIAETLTDPDEIDDEIRTLFDALR